MSSSDAARSLSSDAAVSSIAAAAPSLRSPPPPAAAARFEDLPRDVIAFALRQCLDDLSCTRFARINRRTRAIFQQAAAAFRRPTSGYPTDWAFDWETSCFLHRIRRRRYMSPLQLVHFSRSPAMQLEFDIALVVQCDEKHRLVSHTRGLGNHSYAPGEADITLEQVKAALRRFTNVQALTILVSYVSAPGSHYFESPSSALFYLTAVLQAWSSQLFYLNISLPPSATKSVFEEFIVPHFARMTQLQMIDINADGWADASSFALLPFHRPVLASAPPPLTEADQAAIAASKFLVLSHPHPLVLYSKRYVNGASCDRCSKEIPGKAYSCNECKFDLHPECFVAAGGHDAWLVEKPDPFQLAANGLILFHDRKGPMRRYRSTDRTDLPLARLQFQSTPRNSFVRWFYSNETWRSAAPTVGVLYPTTLQLGAAVMSALPKFTDPAEAALNTVLSDAFVQQFEFLHRRGVQSLEINVRQPPAKDGLQNYLKQFQSRPPPTGQHSLRHISIMTINNKADFCMVRNIMQLIPPGSLDGVTRLAFHFSQRKTQEIPSIKTDAGRETEWNDAIAQRRNQKMEDALKAVTDRMPRLYYLTLTLPIVFTSFGVCFKTVTHLNISHTGADKELRLANQIHLIAVEMRLLQSLSVHGRGWYTAREACDLLLPLLLSSPTLREITYSWKRDPAQLTPLPHGSDATREGTPFRRLHLLWKHLQPSHPLPDLSHQTAEFPDFVNADSLHPRLRVPFLSTEDRMEYAERLAKLPSGTFHTVGPPTSSSSSSSSSASQSPASSVASISSSSPAPTTSRFSASMRTLSQRVLSTVASPFAALQRKREEVAAAARLAEETKMWTDAKTSYLTSLTKHFHPVREVAVAIRPLEIRFLHWTEFDPNWMDEWLPSRRL